MSLFDRFIERALENVERAIEHVQRAIEEAEERLKEAEREFERKFREIEYRFRDIARCEVLDEGDRVRIVVDLPGFRRENIRVYVEDHSIIIRAEEEDRVRARQFYKRFSLPSNVDIDNARASFRNGILEIIVPKRGVRRIKVE